METLEQDEVTDEIATRFTDGVIERSPGLVTLRPALRAAAADVVAEPVVRRALRRRECATLHDDIFTRRGSPAVAARCRA